jgi:L-threonylcarbamoyladenylate synthase
VVDVSGDTPLVLRPGGIAREAIAAALGCPIGLVAGAISRPASPGLMLRHYAPATPLRLEARQVFAGEALLAFGSDLPRHAGPLFNLSPAADLVEAAANLFAGLRSLDGAGAAAIAVMPIPQHGLGEAINDRLRRAARAE